MFTKQVEIIMLPQVTEKPWVAPEGSILKWVGNNYGQRIQKLTIGNGGYFPYWEAQHLYFVSNDAPNIGDWVFCMDVHLNNANHSPDKYINPIRKWNGGDCKACKKIIASTDLSLGLPGIVFDWIKNIYVPSNGSIRSIELAVKEKGYWKAGRSGRDNPDVGDAWESFYVYTFLEKEIFVANLKPEAEKRVAVNNLNQKLAEWQEGEMEAGFCMDCEANPCECNNSNQKLEQAAEKYMDTYKQHNIFSQLDILEAFKSGFRAQEKEMWTDQDMLDFTRFKPTSRNSDKELLEEFKKLRKKQ